MKTCIIENRESEKWWRMQKLLKVKLNLAYDKNAQKQARMFKFFKGIFWKAV